MRRSVWSVTTTLCLLMLTTSTGCAGRRNVLPDCAIERPNAEVLAEQIREAERAAGGVTPLNPATYEYLKRLDRDIKLFGDDR